MKKEKMLISLIVMVIVAVFLGSVNSYATELTNTSTTKNTQVFANTNSNTSLTINTNKTNTALNATTNVSNYNNTNTNATNKTTANTTGLPYAGSGNVMGAVVLFAIFGVSAIYAYKKVTDYNI